MRSVTRSAAAVVLVVAVGGCATSRPRLSVLGREVEVVGRGAEPGRARGELIAVGPEQLWIRDAQGVAAHPLAGLRKVRVERHGLDGKKGLTWALIGALVTGGALTAACSSAEGSSDCGLVFPVVGLSWAVFGGLSALDLRRSSRLSVKDPDWDDLRPYARFPQGIPEGLDLHHLDPDRER
jgi:hypothetical protein